MTKLLSEPGNPSSLHASGRKARRAVEESRERVARAVGCGSAEVVFTAGGTEANNIAVKGIAWDQRNKDPRRIRVVAGSTEHHAVMDPVRWLGESEGFEVTWIKSDTEGKITPDALREALGENPTDVGVVSVILANNEVGTINDIVALTAVTREFGIRFHTDAVQAPAWLDLDFAELGVCAMTISGGPHGIGALIISRDCHVTPLIHGGGQERDVRSGTLDAPAIVGFATALEITTARRTETVARVTGLRDDLVKRVMEIAPDATYTGSKTDRLANNAHFIFPGCLGDSLLMLLDAQGVESSVGSACNAGVPQPSHVLLAMGADDDAARSTLRFSLGSTTTQGDVDKLIEVLPSAIERAKRAGVPKLTTAPVRV
jgi:cysteine desulfurase